MGVISRFARKTFSGKKQLKSAFWPGEEHLKAIRENGLKVIKGKEEFVCKPKTATDNPAEIGAVDYAILSTKSYDLEGVLLQLQPSINQETVILPLLNGVDTREKIKAFYPQNLVLDGCVYIVSRIKEPGVVENSGNVQKLCFGLENYTDEKLEKIDSLLKEAGIDSRFSKNISTVIWEKYILSPLATITSTYDKTAGEIVANEEYFTTLKKMVEEARQPAAKQVSLPEDIFEKTISVMEALEQPLQCTRYKTTNQNRNRNTHPLCD